VLKGAEYMNNAAELEKHAGEELQNASAGDSSVLFASLGMNAS